MSVGTPSITRALRPCSRREAVRCRKITGLNRRARERRENRANKQPTQLGERRVAASEPRRRAAARELKLAMAMIPSAVAAAATMVALMGSKG